MLRLLALSFGGLLLWRLHRVFRPSLFALVFGLFVLYLPLLERVPVNLATGVNLVTLFLIALLVTSHTAGDARVGPGAAAFRNTLLLWLLVGVVGFVMGLGGALPFKELLILFKRWLDPLLFGLLALRLTRRSDRQFLFACLLIGYGMVALQGLREGLDIGYKQRINGLLGQANELGAFLAMYAPVVLASALFLTKGVVRLALCGLLVLGAAALVYTESRASLLALPFGLCLLLGISGRGGHAFLGVLFVTVLATFPGLLPEKATERFQSTYVENMAGTGVQLDQSAEGRLIVWRGAIQMATEHPLGVGFAQFPYEIIRYAHTTQYALDAHNSFLLTWAEFGLGGLFVLLLILARMIIDAWVLARRAADPFLRALGLGLWAALLTAVFVNCFGTRLMEIQVSTYLWMLSALAASARDAVWKDEGESALVEPLEALVRENAWGLRGYSSVTSKENAYASVAGFRYHHHL